MRWNAIPGLETTIRRSRATIDGILWIKKEYGLSISGWKVKIYFLCQGYWIAFKEVIKKLLFKIGLQKAVDLYRRLK